MKFSIITCTYNSAEYLQKNIDSVKNQTCKDFEHIFIDGFSTDDTVEIIKKYQKEFPEKIKFFQFPPKGIGNAMNEGIEKASGEYINHMHSDDSFYNKNILKKVKDFIEKNNNPNWIYGKANFINTDTKYSRIIPHRKIYQKTRFWLLLLTNYIPHQTVFLKKEIFEKFGKFDEQYRNSMDYEFWIKLSKNKISAKFINEIICNFSINSNTQSSKGKENYKKENIIILNKYIKSTIGKLFFYLIFKINNQRKFFK